MSALPVLVSTLISDILKAGLEPTTAQDPAASAARSYLSLTGINFPALTIFDKTNLINHMLCLVQQALISVGLMVQFDVPVDPSRIMRMVTILLERYRMGSDCIEKFTEFLRADNTTVGRNVLNIGNLDGIEGLCTQQQGLVGIGANRWQVSGLGVQAQLEIPNTVLSGRIRFRQPQHYLRFADGALACVQNVQGTVTCNGENLVMNLFYSIEPGRVYGLVCAPVGSMIIAEITDCFDENENNTIDASLTISNLIDLRYVGLGQAAVNFPVVNMFRAAMNGGHDRSATQQFKRMAVGTRGLWLQMYREMTALFDQMRMIDY